VPKPMQQAKDHRYGQVPLTLRVELPSGARGRFTVSLEDPTAGLPSILGTRLALCPRQKKTTPELRSGLVQRRLKENLKVVVTAIHDLVYDQIADSKLLAGLVFGEAGIHFAANIITQFGSHLGPFAAGCYICRPKQRPARGGWRIQISERALPAFGLLSLFLSVEARALCAAPTVVLVLFQSASGRLQCYSYRN